MLFLSSIFELLLLSFHTFIHTFKVEVSNVTTCSGSSIVQLNAEPVFAERESETEGEGDGMERCGGEMQKRRVNV